MGENELTVIVPVYNEEENIERVVKLLSDFRVKSPCGVNFLFVNDGSSDNSQHYIENACRDHPHFDYIELNQNYGLSTALKAGIDHADTDLIGYIDADLQTHPDDFLLLLDYANEYEMVTGIRTQRKDTWLKKISSKCANKIRRSMINDEILDTTCPLKVAQRAAIFDIPFYNGMHRFWPALVKMYGGKVKQVPVRHFPRIAGKGKYHLSNRLWGPLVDTFGVRWIKKRLISYSVIRKDR
ncbi:glycosyltransferase [Fulvivirgaceae bacterium BMA12]|uniref:Glycosyltransferase n=1 Tax=Agaribacillus aureus TaxID=3051825 RepID=A0ABT8LIH3_9BACT|nr:glycosyltransferase [Fulvivirgaceae bacterium BMA12]